MDSPPRRSGRARSTGACIDPVAAAATSRWGVRDDMTGTPRLSVVVPAFNEAESLPELHRELIATLPGLGMSWEVVYVDDGSRDGTDRVIERLCAEDPRARGILLSRNFGKSAALATGFKAVRGEFVCTLDADLQDDPSELPKLFAALEQGLDVVSGWKQKRRDP